MKNYSTTPRKTRKNDPAMVELLARIHNFTREVHINEIAPKFEINKQQIYVKAKSLRKASK